MQYPFPPIIEAVAEFVFEQEIDFDEQKRISQKVNSFYPNERVEIGKQINFDFKKEKVEIKEIDKIIRRRSENEDEIFSIGGASLVVSKLPIYDGWEVFLSRIKRDWDEAKSVTGYRKISRIGLRFVNRIDLPFESDLVSIEDYMNLGLNYPAPLGPMITSSWRSEHPVDDLGAMLILSMAKVESPLPKHMGLLLDIDVAKVLDVPQKDDDIFSYLEKARVFKNSVFELSIKDEARKRFFDDLRIGS